MILTENNISSCGSTHENVTKKKLFSIHFFSEELVLEIFSFVNLPTLGKISCVSKEWQRLASDSILWKTVIYRTIAFGNDKWAQCFGKDIVKDEDSKEDFASLPWKEFIEDCKKFKCIFPGKNAIDCLMLVRLPKTLNGGLTLKSLGELTKKHFPNNSRGYKLVLPDIVQNLGDKSIDTSCWVGMTKDILPKTRSESYIDQQQIVTNLAKKSLTGYEVPEVLKSVACILSQYFGSNIRLFNTEPWTYTRCKENLHGIPIIVGGFSSGGLVIRNDQNPDESRGMAAMRKF